MKLPAPPICPARQRGTLWNPGGDRYYPDHWRWLLIAAATLIFCSCRAPVGPDAAIGPPPAAMPPLPPTLRSTADGIVQPGSASVPLSATSALHDTAANVIPARNTATADDGNNAAEQLGEENIIGFVESHTADSRQATERATAAKAIAVADLSDDQTQPPAPVVPLHRAGGTRAQATRAQYIVAQTPAAGCLEPHTCPQHSALLNDYGIEPGSGIGHAYRMDEYVCDGGDLETRVRFDADGNVRGLDPSDTIAAYRTDDGRLEIVPSNRVCLFAPRFAATRHVMRVNVADEYQRALLADQPIGPDISERRVPSLAVQRRTHPGSHRQLGVPTPLIDRQLGLEVARRQLLDEFDQDYAPHENFQIIRSGILAQRELPLVLSFADAALTWTDNTAVQVVLGTDEPVVVKAADVVGEIFQFEDRGGPEIRIIKLASQAEAQPGEQVEFTLRVDNVGTKTARDLTVLDKLPAKLEFVEGSAQSSAPAEFSAEPDSSGAVVLRWEFREPLEPGDGAVLRFTCRVR